MNEDRKTSRTLADMVDCIAAWTPDRERMMVTMSKNEWNLVVLALRSPAPIPPPDLTTEAQKGEP